jgi:hypothetical protein
MQLSRRIYEMLCAFRAVAASIVACIRRAQCEHTHATVVHGIIQLRCSSVRIAVMSFKQITSINRMIELEQYHAVMQHGVCSCHFMSREAVVCNSMPLIQIELLNALKSKLFSCSAQNNSAVCM